MRLLGLEVSSQAVVEGNGFNVSRGSLESVGLRGLRYLDCRYPCCNTGTCAQSFGIGRLKTQWS